jgi:hypothetical protein
MNIFKVALSSLLAASVAIGSAGVANATGSDASTGVALFTTINPADQTAIDAVATAKATYQSALSNYQKLVAGSKESKKAFNVALKAWQKMDKAQQQAKQRIGKTFNQSVLVAKQAYRSAVTSSTTVSAKAEAKATRDAAIAAASVSRTEALALIKAKVAKPTPPKK